MPRFTPLFCLLFAFTSCFAQTVTVSQPATRVEVRSLVFNDTPGLPDQFVRDAERAVTSRTYGPDYRSAVAETVRDAFQRDGYFKAAIQTPIRVSEVSREKDRLIVNVYVIAVPGHRYDLGPITFRGTTAFPAGTLRQQFPIADGDVVDIEKLRRGIKALKDLYCTKGYINFTPVPDFTFNEREHRMAMVVDVDEGAPYRVGKLTVEGDDVPAARQQLQQSWTKYQGTYSCDPVRQLLTDLHACPSGALQPKVEVQQDNVNHLLDYTIRLGSSSSSAPATCMPR